MPKTQVSKQKSRSKPSRWLLKSFIYLLIFLYGMMIMITALLFLYMQQASPADLPALLKAMGESGVRYPSANFLVYAITLFILNIYFLLTLLRNKRWGFWGFLLSAGVINFIFSLIYLQTTIVNLLLGFILALILYILLIAGGKRSAWSEMT